MSRVSSLPLQIPIAQLNNQCFSMSEFTGNGGDGDLQAVVRGFNNCFSPCSTILDYPQTCFSPLVVQEEDVLKTQHKRVVVEVAAEGLSSDVWAWRKYGQKPIKGSPHPRPTTSNRDASISTDSGSCSLSPPVTPVLAMKVEDGQRISDIEASKSNIGVLDDMCDVMLCDDLFLGFDELDRLDF
ncbi:hypothetical protein C3L33_08528, partial [Rhododendron williamsianum]